MIQQNSVYDIIDPDVLNVNLVKARGCLLMN